MSIETYLESWYKICQLLFFQDSFFFFTAATFSPLREKNPSQPSSLGSLHAALLRIHCQHVAWISDFGKSEAPIPHAPSYWPSALG